LSGYSSADYASAPIWNFNGNEFSLALGADAQASAAVEQTTKRR